MITLAILAGGKLERMSQDKALMPYLGRPLIARVAERLTPVADEVILVTNRTAELACLGLRTFPDLLPGCGALGGLYTALSAAAYPLMAAVACDMPFASPALFEHEPDLLVRAGVDVVIPSTADGLEPLHAVYRRATCLPVIRSAVESNQLKAIDWFPAVRVRE